MPPPGKLTAPLKGWSAPVAVPTGYKICATGFHRAQCHADGQWLEGAKCGTAAVDSTRYRARGANRTVSYGFVKQGQACG